MDQYTNEQLEVMFQEAIEDYEIALENWTLDDEEHEKIEGLRHDIEEIETELFLRKGGKQ